MVVGACRVSNKKNRGTHRPSVGQSLRPTHSRSIRFPTWVVLLFVAALLKSLPIVGRESASKPLSAGMINKIAEWLDPFGRKLSACAVALVLSVVVLLFAGGQARAQEQVQYQYSSATTYEWAAEWQTIDGMPPVEMPPEEIPPVEVDPAADQYDLGAASAPAPEPAPGPPAEEAPAQEGPPANQYEYGTTPVPTPVHGPAPEPAPEPTPDPVPLPEPAPAPVPEPAPEPAPEPTPDTAPAPVPAPAPDTPTDEQYDPGIGTAPPGAPPAEEPPAAQPPVEEPLPEPTPESSPVPDPVPAPAPEPPNGYDPGTEAEPPVRTPTEEQYDPETGTTPPTETPAGDQYDPAMGGAVAPAEVPPTEAPAEGPTPAEEPVSTGTPVEEPLPGPAPEPVALGENATLPSRTEEHASPGPAPSDPGGEPPEEGSVTGPPFEGPPSAPPEPPPGGAAPEEPVASEELAASPARTGEEPAAQPAVPTPAGDEPRHRSWGLLGTTVGSAAEVFGDAVAGSLETLADRPLFGSVAEASRGSLGAALSGPTFGEEMGQVSTEAPEGPAPPSEEAPQPLPAAPSPVAGGAFAPSSGGGAPLLFLLLCVLASAAVLLRRSGRLFSILFSVPGPLSAPRSALERPG